MTQTTMVIIYIILLATSVYLAHQDWGVIAARVREGPKGLQAEMEKLGVTL